MCIRDRFYALMSKQNVQRSGTFYLISGLISLTILAQIMVLFFPIGSITKLILAAILLALAAFKWNDCKSLFNKTFLELSTWSTLSLILLLVSWITVLLMSAGPTMMDDTESYHIQSIKWIQELSLIHISEPTRLLSISYAVFC